MYSPLQIVRFNHEMMRHKSLIAINHCKPCCFKLQMIAWYFKKSTATWDSSSFQGNGIWLDQPSAVKDSQWITLKNQASCPVWEPCDWASCRGEAPGCNYQPCVCSCLNWLPHQNFSRYKNDKLIHTIWHIKLHERVFLMFSSMFPPNMITLVTNPLHENLRNSMLLRG